MKKQLILLLIMLSATGNHFSIFAQTTDYVVITDEDGARDISYKADTILLYKYADKMRQPANFIYREDLRKDWTDEEYKKIWDCIYKAFTPERYNYLAQNKQGFMTEICQDVNGNVKYVSFGCSKYETLLTVEDFVKIDKQLKALKLSISPAYINFSFIRSSGDWSFSNNPYQYDAIYEAEKCNPASPNYNAILCQISKCDPRSPNYDPAFCVQAVCDPGSSSYNKDRCEQTRCDFTTTNYSCTQCQQLRITPGSAVYDQNIAQLVGLMQQGAYEQAAQVIAGMSDYLIWQEVNYEFLYDAGTNDFDYNNADPSNIYVTIGTFFNANVYHGTLCRDLYHKLLLTLIDKGDDMPEYKFWARCESIFADESPSLPQASPRAIKAWYLEAVQLYNTIPAYYRSQFTPLYDRLVAFYNANQTILDNPPAEW